MHKSLEQHMAERATPEREQRLRDATGFFLEHGPTSWHPDYETEEEGALRGARELAEAELFAKDHGWTFTWRDDRELDHVHEFEAYGEEPETCEQATLYDEDDNDLASLGCIDDATDDYRRVVEAQLADEAIERLHDRSKPEHFYDPKRDFQVVTCGTCGLQWCGVCHPAPSARCHNEYDHADPEDEARARLELATHEANGDDDMVWTLTIDDDKATTTTVYRTEEGALDGLRAYFDGDDVDYDNILDWATSQGGVCVYLEQQPIL